MSVDPDPIVDTVTEIPKFTTANSNFSGPKPNKAHHSCDPVSKRNSNSSGKRPISITSDYTERPRVSTEAEDSKGKVKKKQSASQWKIEEDFLLQICRMSKFNIIMNRQWLQCNTAGKNKVPWLELPWIGSSPSSQSASGLNDVAETSYSGVI